MKFQRRRSVLLVTAILFVASTVGIVPQRALASGTDTWTGNAGDYKWSSAGNWTSGVPTNGMALNFPQEVGPFYPFGGYPLDDIAGLSITSLTFAGGTIGGTQPLTVGSIALASSGSGGVISIPNLSMTGSTPSSISTQGSTLDIRTSLYGSNGVQLGPCGNGSIDLNSSDNSGAATITDCEVHVWSDNSAVTVKSGGVLYAFKMTSLTVESGGTAWTFPGTTTGSCTLDGDLPLQMQYPRYYSNITCSGQVSLGGRVSISPYYLYLGQDDQMTIIHNTSGLPVSGTFANLPEGGTLDNHGQALSITYHGGSSGHDVVLTAISDPFATSTYSWDPGLYAQSSADYTSTHAWGRRTTAGAWGTRAVNYQSGATTRARAGTSGSVTVSMFGTYCPQNQCSYGAGSGYKGLVQFWNDPNNYIAFGLIHDPGVSPNGTTLMVEGAANGRPVGGYWANGVVTGSAHRISASWNGSGITFNMDGVQLGPYPVATTNPSVSFLAAARNTGDIYDTTFSDIFFGP